MTLPKLLITGHSGLLGGILWRGLADAFECYGADNCLRVQTDNVFRADVSNAEQVDAVFARIPGFAYVVHLAADPRVKGDWQSVLMNNIVATRNLYEAARGHGVKRVVFASSNHVTGGYQASFQGPNAQPMPALITPEQPLRPDGYYGVSKAAGEAIARMYYDLYGLESVCLRIGFVLKDDDPGEDERSRRMWLSHRDLVQLVKKSLSAEVGFAIYYGVSNNSKRFCDISNAIAEIGYRPQDNAFRR